MKTAKTILRVLALLTALSILCGACGETVYSMRKTKVYETASLTARKISIPAGMRMEMDGEENGFAAVTRNGICAYIPKEDIAVYQEMNITAYTKEVTPVYPRFGNAKEYVMAPKDLAVTVTATLGDWACVYLNGKKGFVSTEALTLSVPEETVDPGIVTPGRIDEISGATAARGRAVDMDWWMSDIQTIFAKGVTATITDVATGIAWQEVRKGGSKHADCQPLTAKDTAALKKAVGKYSWDRRAIFVTINGVNYAASMNCMPHGSGSITNNNFDGHHCIHFTNSRTEDSDKVCPDHKAAIQKALKANLK